MTIEHRLAHSGFTLTRDYPVPVEEVWRAFADEGQRRSWFGDGETFESLEWSFDFRVGGRDIDAAKFHDGPLSRYEAVYTDIIENVRIVTTCDMWLDGLHMSTSVAAFEFEQIPRAPGSRMPNTASSSTRSGQTAPIAKKAPGGSSKHSADISASNTRAGTFTDARWCQQAIGQRRT